MNGRRSLVRSMGEEEFYMNRYDIKLINSLVLDFEMLVEESEFSDEDVSNQYKK